MGLLANQPSSIAKVLDSSFKLYLLSFKKVIGFGIIISILYIGMALTSYLLMPEQTSSPEEILLMAPPLVLLIIAVSLFSFIIYAAMIYRIDNVARGQVDSFNEAMSAGFRKFLPMLAAIFLYSIAILLGTALLVIPGLILMLSLAFYAYFIVLENETGYQALKSSHRLVWKDWWRTLAVFTVPGVILMIAFFCIGLVAVLLGTNEEQMNWMDVGMNVFSGIYMPYFYALGYVQYRDLKLRKSGSDLEERMFQQN